MFSAFGQLASDQINPNVKNVYNNGVTTAIGLAGLFGITVKRPPYINSSYTQLSAGVRELELYQSEIGAKLNVAYYAPMAILLADRPPNEDSIPEWLSFMETRPGMLNHVKAVREVLDKMQAASPLQVPQITAFDDGMMLPGAAMLGSTAIQGNQLLLDDMELQLDRVATRLRQYEKGRPVASQARRIRVQRDVTTAAGVPYGLVLNRLAPRMRSIRHIIVTMTSDNSPLTAIGLTSNVAGAGWVAAPAANIRTWSDSADYGDGTTWEWGGLDYTSSFLPTSAQDLSFAIDFTTAAISNVHMTIELDVVPTVYASTTGFKDITKGLTWGDIYENGVVPGGDWNITGEFLRSEDRRMLEAALDAANPTWLQAQNHTVYNVLHHILDDPDNADGLADYFRFLSGFVRTPSAFGKKLRKIYGVEACNV
jgi:hypothetical protein